MSLRFTAITGQASDPELSEQLHRLGHQGRVEYLTIGTNDLARKRLRAVTDKGTECAIALPRSVSLAHGAVLEISPQRAIVVQLKELPWLTLEATDRASALRLGFLAGHHHWRVRFAGSRVRVALEAPIETYTARFSDELEAGAVRIVDADDE